MIDVEEELKELEHQIATKNKFLDKWCPVCRIGKIVLKSLPLVLIGIMIYFIFTEANSVALVTKILSLLMICLITAFPFFALVKYVSRKCDSASELFKVLWWLRTRNSEQQQKLLQARNIHKKRD